MKHKHFETLKPICPVCRLVSDSQAHALNIGTVENATDDAILEGTLLCSNEACLREYPIIDGIPLIIPDIRAWVSENAVHICARNSLGATTESILGDCCGQGSWYDVTRQHLSSYAWDHYADLDPDEPTGRVCPGSAIRVMDEGFNAAPDEMAGPILEVGCSVGRTSFALAERSDELVLGIDLHYPMLRLATNVLQTGVVRYPRKRVGVVYDRREFQTSFNGSDRVDFWACDASALPFRENTFGTTVALNVLDCASSPIDFLNSIARTLRPGGQTVMASPYDWSTGATAIESWLGGHSQRGPLAGSSDSFLRSLLTPGGHPMGVSGLELVAERDEVPWHVRMHERSTVEYSVHVVVAKAT